VQPVTPALSDRLSVTRVPFCHAVEECGAGRFEILEYGGALSRAARLISVFLLILGLIDTLLLFLIDEHNARARGVVIVVGVALIGLGLASLTLASRARPTKRVLRYDPGTASFRLARCRGKKEVDALEAPLDQCELLIHAIDHDVLYDRWAGVAAVLHLRSGPHRQHMALAALESEPLIRAYLDELPPPLLTMHRGVGPVFRGTVVITRLQSRRTRRASRGSCPNCGYDLSTLLSTVYRCPECGWKAPAGKKS